MTNQALRTDHRIQDRAGPENLISITSPKATTRHEKPESSKTEAPVRWLIPLAPGTPVPVLDDDDRGASDDLRLQFEVVAQFDPEARKVAKTVLDGLILQYQARRLATGNSLGER